jgi:Ca2+-binding EF-hand superfamily protein/regulator of replication initiation timing
MAAILPYMPDENTVNTSEGFSTVDMHDLERQQLVMWGEDRQREVAKLQGEKASLGQRLAEVQPRCAELQAEVERLTARCGELEGENASCVSENKELRKQLAAYAVEITVLREDRDSDQQALRDAHAQVQRLSEERSEMVRSVQDYELEHSRSLLSSPSRRGQSEGGSAVETLTRLPLMDTDEERRSSEEKDRKIDALLDVIQPLREQVATLKHSFTHQTKEFENFVKTVRQKQDEATKGINSLNISLAEHWHSTQNMPEMMKDIVEAHTGSHRTYVEQECAMRNEQHAMRADLEDSRRHTQAWLEHSRTKEQRLEELTAQEKERKVARLARQDAVQDGWLSENIYAMGKAIKELSNVKKIHQQQGSKQMQSALRHVKVDDGQGIKPLLVWRKPGSKHDIKEVELSSVLHIQYGAKSRAYYVAREFKEKVDPRQCFGVVTSERSLDFICPEGDDARHLVLSISRLCNHITGFSVPGSLPTYALFCRARAWAAIHHHCLGQNNHISTPLYKAVEATVQAVNAKNEAAMRAASGATPRSAAAAAAAALEDAPPGSGRDWHDVNRMKEAFKLFADKSGRITATNLNTIMLSIGMHYNEQDLNQLIQHYNRVGPSSPQSSPDDLATIDFDGFSSILEHSRKTSAEQEIITILQKIDSQGKGYISCTELRHIITGLLDGESELHRDDVNELIREVDTDGNNQISVTEFIKTMVQK